MRKFIIKAIIFFVLLTVIILYFSSKYKEVVDIHSDYMAAIIDKHRRLEAYDSNRILLAGGSNVAFGLNSALLDSAFKRPVVNMGLHVGLGLTFIINELISVVKKGDVVIFTPEYHLLNGTSEELALINHTINLYPEAKSYYPFTLLDKTGIAITNFIHYFHYKEVWLDTIYFRNGFNKYGDLISHLNKAPLATLEFSGINIEKINLNDYQFLLKKLYDTCIQVGASLYFTFPPLPVLDYQNSKIAIINLQQQLKKNMPFIKVINQPEDYVLPDSLFYNSIYHLNAKGRELRTHLLIRELKAYQTN
ncbi:hypothetical protein BH10BAC3_BH10BAC3_09570 [soil metagenome]